MRMLIQLTSDEIKEIDQISKQRFENAKATSKQYTYGGKKPPKNHARDFLGLCGEWAVEKYLLSEGIKILQTCTKDVTSRKSYQDKGDFTIEIDNKEYTLEVKTTKSFFNSNLLIPKHKKRNACDIYCLVKKLGKHTYEVSGFIDKENAFNHLDKTRASPCYATHEDLLKSFLQITKKIKQKH